MHPRHPETLPGVLAAAAGRHAEHPAIEDGALRWTFGELLSRVEDAAAAFVAAGLRPGERVAVWAPNSAQWIVAALGAQSAGAALVPVNTRLKGREAGDILRRSHARILCHAGEFLGQRYDDLLAGEALPELSLRVALDDPDWLAGIGRPDAAARAEAQRRAAALRPGDIADIMFTSGTTGAPKGVMSAHGQNVRVFTEWSRLTGLTHGDRYLIVNPFFHAFGYKAGWLACLITGATMLPMAVFDAAEVIRRIAADRVSVLPGPPTLFQSMLADPALERSRTSSLRLAVTGAASVPVTLIERMHSELGFRTILTGYGLTESTGTVSMCRAGDPPETVAHSCGAPLPGVQVRICDAAGRELPRGEPGEILVRGYNVMQGYLDDPEATAAAIDPDGWLHTGDIGTMDERGYLRITDRKKDMFIVGGFNCYPAEIENLASAHPAVAQVAVVGVPDERLGEVAAAYVVAKPGLTLEAGEFIAWCRANMANYKVPRHVRVVDALPTTASGKVQRFALRDASPEAAPRSDGAQAS